MAVSSALYRDASCLLFLWCCAYLACAVLCAVACGAKKWREVRFVFQLMMRAKLYQQHDVMNQPRQGIYCCEIQYSKSRVEVIGVERHRFSAGVVL